MLKFLFQLHVVVNVYFPHQVAAGKMMDQGPVLVITFTSQQIMVVRDMKGTVVEGDPVSIIF